MTLQHSRIAKRGPVRFAGTAVDFGISGAPRRGLHVLALDFPTYRPESARAVPKATSCATQTTRAQSSHAQMVPVGSAPLSEIRCHAHPIFCTELNHAL